MDPLTISAAISASIALIEYIIKARADMEQNAEYSDADRAVLDAKIASIPNLPHWQVKD